MAIQKLKWLDAQGVEDMSTLLYKSVNTRIKERIATAVTDGTSGTINSRTDDNHTLSAKIILGLTDGILNTIGDDADTVADGTVYGYINDEISTLEQTIGGLTHLNFEVVTGDIATEVPANVAKEDVIYLQHDEPSYSVGNDGYLLDSNGDHASYTDESGSEPVTYEAWVDPADGVAYKMVAGVKGAALQDDDPIFENVAEVEDTTYNLYIWHRTSAEGVTPVTHEWLCVGDTSLELSNYWSKSDADVLALRNLMMQALSQQEIEAAVHDAFDNTDPYAGSTSYLDNWVTA